MLTRYFWGIMILLSAIAPTAWAVPDGLIAEPHIAYNTGVAGCGSATSGGNLLAISVSECKQDKDLNSDNDKDDLILVYYDIAKQSLYNTGVVLTDESLATDGRIIAFHTASAKLAYYDVSEGKVVETTTTDSRVHSCGVYQSPRRVSNGRILYSNDNGICYYDTKTAATVCPGIDGSSVSIDGDMIAYLKTSSVWWNCSTFGEIAVYNIATGQDVVIGKGSSPVIADGIIAFETSNGPLQYHVLSTGQTLDTPIRYAYGPNSFSIDDGIIAALVTEADYWGDLIAPCGIRYELLVYFDINSGRLVNPRIQGCCSVDIRNGVVAYGNWEGYYGEDLNGDGDDEDCVQHYMILGSLVGNNETVLQKKPKSTEPRWKRMRGGCCPDGGGCGKKN